MVVIIDNGLSRLKASQMDEKREGKGILILNEYLELFKEQLNRKMTFKVTDVENDNLVTETKIEVFITL